MVRCCVRFWAQREQSGQKRTAGRAKSLSRACICAGFGGANVAAWNLLFNTVRCVCSPRALPLAPPCRKPQTLEKASLAPQGHLRPRLHQLLRSAPVSDGNAQRHAVHHAGVLLHAIEHALQQCPPMPVQLQLHIVACASPALLTPLIIGPSRVVTLSLEFACVHAVQYQSIWPSDHDDGSCQWFDEGNFFVYAGPFALKPASRFAPASALNTTGEPQRTLSLR